MKRVFILSLFFIIFMIILGITEVQADSEVINFEYKGQEYNVNVGKVVNEKGDDISNYPYYVITANASGGIEIYYSNSRIVLVYYTSGRYKYCMKNPLRLGLDMEGNVSSYTKYSSGYPTILTTNSEVNNYGYIGSNQNIYYNEEIFFTKNHGYTYEFLEEKEELVNEVVKVKNSYLEVIRGAAVNYDFITTLKVGSIITRIKKEVNTINGQVWDKIRLGDGTEGYVISENLEEIENYEKLEFKYKEKVYEIYYDFEEQGININDYPYYVITVNELGGIEIYYSNSRIVLVYYTSGRYKYCMKNPLRLGLDMEGNVSSYTKYSSGYPTILTTNSEVNNYGYIGSNQNIYYNEDIFFTKNHGYTYEFLEEKEELVNEVVKVKNSYLEVIRGAAVNYDFITTLKVGSIITRIKKEVNTTNGQVWDKIRLGDGTEGYVLSENLEEIKNYEKLEFEYKEKVYEIYYNFEEQGINISDYPYYVITANASGGIEIYYSNSRILLVYYTSGKYRYCMENPLKLGLDVNGMVSSYTKYSSGYPTIPTTNSEVNNYGYIGSNQDIYYGDNIKFNINENILFHSINNGTDLNETVKITGMNNIKVMSGPALCYTEIESLREGDIITRIKLNVASANGLLWDKVRLENGKEGYIPSHYLEVISGIWTTFNGYTYTNNINEVVRVESGAKEGIKKGELVYNSQIPIEEEIEEYTIIRNKMLSNSSLAYLLGAKDAGSNLRYYLTFGNEYAIDRTSAVYKNGEIEEGKFNTDVDEYYKNIDRKEILWENAVEDVSLVKQDLKNSINDMIQAAENMISDTTANNFYIKSTLEHTGSIEKMGENPNWFLAINNYRIQDETKVNKNNNSYNMIYTYKVEDYYDYSVFSGEKAENLLQEIFYQVQSDLSYLNIYGIAKNYINFDVLTYNVTWYQGQRFGNNIEPQISGPGF